MRLKLKQNEVYVHNNEYIFAVTTNQYTDNYLDVVVKELGRYLGKEYNVGDVSVKCNNNYEVEVIHNVDEKTAYESKELQIIKLKAFASYTNKIYKSYLYK